MAELTYRQAISEAIARSMRRDERVVFLGEDVARAGGAFKTTVGLLDEFGPNRVWDTPIAEQGHHRRGHGSRHVRSPADRRDHVL